MKFQTKNHGVPAKKRERSPMQDKGWAKAFTDYEDAIPLLEAHLTSGAAWSGDPVIYLNAVWHACEKVAVAQGLLDSDSILSPSKDEQ